MDNLVKDMDNINSEDSIESSGFSYHYFLSVIRNDGVACKIDARSNCFDYF